MDPSKGTPREPQVEASPALQAYYGTFESRVVYQIVLEGNHHFGYYEKDTYWPFPIGPSLRRMKDKVLGLLELPTGSKLLDAGCGNGHTALYMAQHGMHVTGIDVIDHMLDEAQQKVKRASDSDGQLVIRKLDFHHLQSISREYFDGIYTLQSFGHATDPEKVLAGFLRILKPGGRIVLVETEPRRDFDADVADDELDEQLKLVSRYTVLPVNDMSREGYFQALLESAGFVDVKVCDWSENIKPILRLFYAFAWLPFFFVRLFHLEKRYVNMVAGTAGYLGLPKRWRFLAISASKPKDVCV
ncbi:hypothetical protein ONS95_011589 [Cadophora gregata]|uniref:uncharacterized protein n=1 Tax=Cadophora gregata TaxID=51156 RepID=UPI0026DDB70D|nr:uncharacterized protein ONS95_011589 [Cadophora gregata]KAK0120183.1 hypothetical protein ONS95_011589 [Cadophora gregata]KAK0121213.1 hypothetical protein ONS96_011390 [Cadophora gregata f. sp. sojae]